MSVAAQEVQILERFLCADESLQECVPFAQFSSWFPSSQRQSPAIRKTYNRLRRLWDKRIDAVRRNIRLETSLTQQQIQQQAVFGLQPEQKTEDSTAQDEFHSISSHVAPNESGQVRPLALDEICERLQSALSLKTQEIERMELEVTKLRQENKRYISFCPKVPFFSPTFAIQLSIALDL